MNGEQPNDLAAEQAVLGAILTSECAIVDVLEVLKAEDFYQPKHALIFTIAAELYGGGIRPDPIVVLSEVTKRGKVANIGGGTYLIDLTQSVPVSSNAGHYARLVADKARLRRLMQCGIRFQQLGITDATSTEEVDAVLAQAEAFFRDIQEPPRGASTLTELVQDWRTFQQDPDDIISSPWPSLNRYLGGGARKGKVIVCGGRPGSGKSLFGLNWAGHVAEQRKRAIVFSMEMNSNEVISRLLAGGASASIGEIFRKSMTQETHLAVEEYIHTHGDMDLVVVDQSTITVEQIAAQIRANKPDLAFIDYCQLIAPSDNKAPRREQIDHISRTLKVTAGDTNTAIVLASQLNRSMTKDGGRAPQVSDLRESGGIENDADTVLLLHRPENDELAVRIHIGKNRDGKQGTLELMFRGNIARLDEPA